MPNLAAQFERDMRADSEEYTRKIRTNPSRYLQMIAQYGGVETGRLLAADPKHHEGFTRAWENGCLDLTVEYLIVFARDGLYHRLFSESEIAAARKKLKSVGVAAPIVRV